MPSSSKARKRQMPRPSNVYGTTSHNNYAFKHKGNEEQASFNCKVEDIADSMAELTTMGTAPAVEWALKALHVKRCELLSAHQNLIRIADRSDFGWGDRVRVPYLPEYKSQFQH